MSDFPSILDETLAVDGRDVLDVGCGDGWMVRHLTRRGAEAVGVDPAPTALAAARAQTAVGGERYVQAGAQDLPFADRSYDAVLFINSLHHVEASRLDSALSEAGRVLRAEGELYVQEPLTEGAYFELMRPLDDETAVRKAAWAALRRAAAGPVLEPVAEQVRQTVIRLRDFDDFRQHQVLVDPARRATIEGMEGALRAAFDELGRPTSAGHEFSLPVRVTVLRRRADA